MWRSLRLRKENGYGIRVHRSFLEYKALEGCAHGHVDSLIMSAGSGALTHG